MDLSCLSAEEAEKLIHELHVHQMELEIQNEDLRQAHLAVEESRDKYSDLYDFAPVGYLTLDTKGIVLDANLTVARLLATDRRQLIDRHFSRFLGKEDSDTYYLFLKRLFRSKERHSCEATLPRNNGHAIVIQLDGIRVKDTDGSNEQCLITVTDVTDRKRAEESLRQSEERFRSIIEQAADAIFLHDLNGRVLEANQQACASLGYTRSELLSMSVSDLDPDMERRGDRTKFWPNLPATFEARNRRKDGTIFPVEIRLGPIEYGKTKVVLALVRNISDRKRAEEELTKAKDLAEMASRAKSEFLANMSHELRTPLNSIIGFSEILEDQLFGPLNETQTQHVKHIVHSGHHLLQLVNQLLDLAKIEYREMPLVVCQVNVIDMLEKSLMMVREAAVSHDVLLELRASPEVEGMTVLADELKLRQVMLNLLSNAIKFTPARGRIRIEAARVERTLTISVCDTGVGIDPTDTSRIFKAFEQVDSTLSRSHDGTGLGLSLARKLIALHGGSIWVESDGLGKGSTFKFAIPLSGHAEDT